MRVLGIETSTQRGSVALVADGQEVGALEHALPDAHAEQILPLVERLLASAGWGRSSLDRLAVGIGPGSFTGLRVGIALARGIALGLDRPLVGVGSLRAMARGVPRTEARARIAALDARRGELFLAAYSRDGAELIAPVAVDRARAAELVERSLSGTDAVGLGDGAGELGSRVSRFTRPDVDLPHATWVAVIGAELDPERSAAEPEYVRGPGATLPNLPPSPLDPY